MARVLAHCRTGTRSLMVGDREVLDGRMTLADVDELGGRHGFDLSGVRAEHRAGY